MLIISGLLKPWFLNPIKINLQFETHLTVVLNAEQEYSAFGEILLTHKSQSSCYLTWIQGELCTFTESFYIPELTQPPAQHYTPSPAHGATSRTAPLFHSKVLRAVTPSPSTDLPGSCSRCSLSAGHRDRPRTSRRSAGVQQFQH